jgi:ABC-type amino acid transport substrate-binding protein
LALANTLTKYSEKGKTYVNTLKSIIQTNGLDIADNARLRDEPLVFIVNVETEDQVKEVRQEIDQMRASGELIKTIQGMRLGED